MKPPKFDYFAPDSIESALTLIAEHGDDARYLAGGQSLVPMMNFRVAAPSALIDLNGIATLRGIKVDKNSRLHIGAMTRTREIEMDSTIASANPLLHAAAPHIAHIQIRNRVATARLGWQPRLFNPNLRKWLHRITVPTHVIWGDTDRIVDPVYAAEFGNVIAGSQVTMIEKAGHLPHIEQAEPFVAAVNNFIQSKAA